VLRWSHRCALMLLQGGGVGQVVGAAWQLVGGRHRPFYYAVPGVDAPLLAEVRRVDRPLTWAQVQGFVLDDAAQRFGAGT